MREYLNVPQIPFPDEPITMVRVHFCRTCVHRLRFSLNEHSNKVVQCCELQPIKRFGGYGSFDNQIERDNALRQYCKEHKIKLIEIPYTQKKNINETLKKELKIK